MAAILSNLNRTVTVAFVLVLVVLVLMGVTDAKTYSLKFSKVFFEHAFRWFHVLSGIMWVGLLYYFNFVQMPSMPKIPDAEKPAVSKVIAPAALFWFRWAAMSTIVTGLIVAWLGGYLVDAILLGLNKGWGGKATMIGLGMYLGTIMWFNVWFLIWPNQKKALGIVEASADEKKAAARTAMLFSRTNVMLSAPMLYCMVMAKSSY